VEDLVFAHILSQNGIVLNLSFVVDAESHCVGAEVVVCFATEIERILFDVDFWESSTISKVFRFSRYISLPFAIRWDVGV